MAKFCVNCGNPLVSAAETNNFTSSSAGDSASDSSNDFAGASANTSVSDSGNDFAGASMNEGMATSPENTSSNGEYYANPNVNNSYNNAGDNFNNYNDNNFNNGFNNAAYGYNTYADNNGNMGMDMPSLIRGFAASPKFMAASILYTCAIVLSFLSSFNVSSQAQEYLDMMSKYLDYPSMNLTGVSAISGIFSSLLSLLPEIAICVGLWLVFSSAKNSAPMQSTGLNVMRITNIVLMVIMDIALAFAAIILFISCLVVSSYSIASIVILLLALFVIVVIAALYNVYFIKLMGTLNWAISVIDNKECKTKPSTYVFVIIIISTAFTCLSALLSLFSGSFLAFLTAGCNIAAQVLFLIILNDVKTLSYRLMA